MAVPIRLEIFDKAFNQLGTIGDPKYVTLIPRYNRGGQASFGVRSNHHRINHLITNGTRCKFINEHEETLFSGPITGFRSSGPEKGSVLEFDVRDDFNDIFVDTLGWVIPGAAIDAQGTAGTNWTMTDDAETVLKAAVAANARDRLGKPITVPVTQGRGPQVKAKLRFQSLYDRLFPVLDGAGIEAAGIGFRVVQSGAGLLLETYEPRTIPQEISESSGIVRSWSYTYDYTTVTRVVVGGEGSGTLRVLRERVNTARESALNRKLEVFRDARDTDVPSELYERADETLAEGATKTGLAVELSETKNFKYRPPTSTRSGVSTGDQMTIRMGAVSVTDRLQEVTLSWTADGGFITRPRVGDRQDDPDRKMALKLKNIIRSIRTRNSEV